MDSDPRAVPGSSKDAIIDDSSYEIGTVACHAAGGIKTSFHGRNMDSDPRAVPGSSKDAIIDDSSCEIGTGACHAAGGIKTSFHGYIYQVKLAMFFILRALMKNFIFNIGTEVDEAKTFDDLVFVYENETGKKVIFLQAKHRLNDEITINEIDLLNENGHFSMRTHYSSYMTIREEKYFKEILNNAKVTLVLCTNIGIESSILKENFEEVRTGEFATNDFLHPGSAADYAKFYKIIPHTTFYNYLVCFLEKNYLPSTLAQLLAKKVVNNKKKSIKIDDQFERYRESLLDKIFYHGTDIIREQKSYYVCFKEDFLIDNNLSEDLRKFRKEFITSFITESNNLRKQSKSPVTEESVQKELSSVKFKVTKAFIKGQVTKENKAKEYIDALIFAVNQPSEDKLGNIVEKEVGEYAELTDRKSIACKFHTYILDWVKQRKGRFLKKEDVEEQFAVWRQTDLSHRHIGEVKNVGYAFEQDDVIVNVSNFLKDDSGQIICLYYSDQLLTEIKLCQALKYEGDTKNEFIFSDIGTLSEQVNTKMCPVKAFNSQACNDVFVIIKKKSEVKQKQEMLLRRLLDIVKTDIKEGRTLGGKKAGKAKKRILMLIPLKHATINERDGFFQNVDSEDINRIILEDSEVKFSNLNDDSRRKLFEKGLHRMVGTEIGEIVIDTFNDFTLQSIWKAIRYNLDYKDKPINDHLDHWKEKLSRFIKDDVLSELMSGDAAVYKDLNKNYDEMTKYCSEKINDDILSTIITESTRPDTAIEEKVFSFFFNSASLITPLIEEWNKND